MQPDILSTFSSTFSQHAARHSLNIQPDIISTFSPTFSQHSARHLVIHYKMDVICLPVGPSIARSSPLLACARTSLSIVCPLAFTVTSWTRSSVYPALVLIVLRTLNAYQDIVVLAAVMSERNKRTWTWSRRQYEYTYCFQFVYAILHCEHIQFYLNYNYHLWNVH